MTPRILPYNPRLKAIARKLRQNMTHSEIVLWQHLKSKQMGGYDFDRQRPIDEYIIDFYCKKLMLAIEIDGGSHDSQDAQEKDRYRQSRLESLGVHVLRFQDKDVLQNTETILTAIALWIQEYGR
ncbi:MAG: endonuclease domain-containing protein [Cyanobacteria bacterium P01_G01_bin.54]